MKNAVEILTSSEKFHINLGLKRIKTILSLLGNPQNSYKIIHVAGTNGKGSVCKIINDILIQNFKDTNIQVGLYTSPHLFSYCERIKINNINIKDSVFNRLVNDINNFALKNNIELSEFELLSVVAFHYFYIKKVDYVILEVGMGGRYDATNVVDSLVEVITTIDYDHISRLGDTINKIAFQKAGIIKDNSKVVIDKRNLGYDVILKVAKSKNAKIITTNNTEVNFKNGKNIAKYKNQEFEFGLLGKHQEQNLALALAAIENIGVNISQETLKKALKNVSWRFRMEYIKEKNILIDGAHNPSGIKILKEFLDENFSDVKKTFVFGCLNNKDYSAMLDILLGKDDEVYFYDFEYPNALKYEEIKDKYEFFNIKTIDEIENIISSKDNLKIFCGSLYMLGLIFSKIKL